jgi:hypothetical protein
MVRNLALAAAVLQLAGTLGMSMTLTGPGLPFDFCGRRGVKRELVWAELLGALLRAKSARIFSIRSNGIRSLRKCAFGVS